MAQQHGSDESVEFWIRCSRHRGCNSKVHHQIIERGGGFAAGKKISLGNYCSRSPHIVVHVLYQIVAEWAG